MKVGKGWRKVRDLGKSLDLRGRKKWLGGNLRLIRDAVMSR